MIRTEGVFGQGRGYSNNYYRVNAFVPRHVVPGQSLFFTSLAGSATDDGKGVSNIGFGYRHYIKSMDRIISASGWFDVDDGHNETFYQAGANFASMGRYLDFHLNGTMIVGKDSHQTFQGILGQAYYEGNSLLQNFVTITENAYSGADAELGGPLPFLGRYGVNAYVGGYYLNSREDEETSGVRLRVLGHISDEATVSMEYTSDGVFGDNAFVNVSLTFPPGRRTRLFRQPRVRERMASPVVRNDRIATRMKAEKRDIFAINPIDNQPYSIVHVDPNQGLGGSGTFENPYNTLEAARNPNPAFVDIIRVIPREDGTNTNLALTDTFVLTGTQRLLGSTTIHNFNTPDGFFELPGYTGFGDGPMISNTALIASTVVQMTGGNEVSGFLVDGQDALGNAIHNGITGTNTSGFSVNSNTFQNLVEAVTIVNNGSGTGNLVNNTFNGNGHLSNHAFNLTNNGGSSLNLLVQGNTVTNHLGEDLNFNGLLDPGEDTNPANAALDEGIAFNIYATGASTINASTATGHGFLNNIATGNGTGLDLEADAGSTIIASIIGNTFSNNSDPNTGARITADAGTIHLQSFANNIVDNNGGNGLLMSALNAGVINSLLSEDVNNNGSLGAGEDLNGNGVLDFGITGNQFIGNAENGLAAIANGAGSQINNLHIGGADSTLPDTTIIGTVGQVDNIFTGNGTGALSGSGIFLSTLTTGSITGSIVNNTIESNLQDGIEIDANTGTITLAGGIQNNSLRNNAVSGISLTGTAAASTSIINLGQVDNNNFDRETAGENGIFFDVTGADVTADVAHNRFVTVPGLNANGSFGIGGTVTDGFLVLTVGGATPDEGNLFDFNANAAIGVTVAGTSAGSQFNIQQNTITRTSAGADAIFQGEGIHIRATDSANISLASIIDRNLIGDLNNAAFGNVSHGVAIDVRQNAIFADLEIGSDSDGDNNNANIIANNGADGINIARLHNGNLTDFRIYDNTVTNNGDDGISLSSENANTTDFIDVYFNNLSDNADVGVTLHVGADAILNADLVDNQILRSGTDGILITEQVNDPADLRSVVGNWTGNTINFSGAHGIQINGATGDAANHLVIGTADGLTAALGNDISNNAGDGVEINGAGTLTLGDNMINFNGTGGVDFNPATVNTLNLFSNTIHRNTGDGLEIIDANRGGVTVNGANNLISENTGRGIDILNQGTFGFMDINLTDENLAFAVIGGNTVIGNGEEGVYVVNTASTSQNQTDASTVAMAADGALSASPFMDFDFINGAIIGNGNNSGFEGTGLVLRVGATFGLTGIGNISDAGGFADTRSGIEARVTGTTMTGNFGEDFIAQSFISTVAPAVTAGTWTDADFTVTTFEQDPLARLDLTWGGVGADANIYDVIDPNEATAFNYYNNAEGVYKSRLNNIAADPGPFTSATRRRSAQRQAARLPNLDAPNPGFGASFGFLYSGTGTSTFRVNFNGAGDDANFLIDTTPFTTTPTHAFGEFLGGSITGELPSGWSRF